VTAHRFAQLADEIPARAGPDTVEWVALAIPEGIAVVVLGGGLLPVSVQISGRGEFQAVTVVVCSDAVRRYLLCIHGHTAN
jgi:hypothetical protein